MLLWAIIGLAATLCFSTQPFKTLEIAIAFSTVTAPILLTLKLFKVDFAMYKYDIHLVPYLDILVESFLNRGVIRVHKLAL